jgi:hypothetical protein
MLGKSHYEKKEDLKQLIIFQVIIINNELKT